MPKFIDITGQRYGSLTVFRRASSTGKYVKWLAVCDCGQETVKRSEKLRRDLRCNKCAEKLRVERQTKHGLSKSRTYDIWVGMRSRCDNPNNVGFPDYGGSGIKVCEEWKSFEVFLLDMGIATEGLSIDRIDGKKGYFPGNCRWATSAQQARNKRTNHNITWQGETLCMRDWADRLGMIPETLYSRIVRYGWTIDRAFTRPISMVDDRYAKGFSDGN